MVCKLYDNKSKSNVIHKDITQVGNDKTVILKYETDIINPTIYLSVDSNSLKFNYVYLEDLRRYYYVTGITTSHERIIVELAVDVLMSFANEIMLNDCILERQENVYNIYQHDDEVPQLMYDDVYTIGAPNDLIDTNNTTFILATAGG